MRKLIALVAGAVFLLAGCSIHHKCACHAHKQHKHTHPHHKHEPVKPAAK